MCVSVCVCACLCGSVSKAQSQSHTLVGTLKANNSPFPLPRPHPNQFPAASSQYSSHSASLVQGISSLLLLFTAFISSARILIHLAIDRAAAERSHPSTPPRSVRVCVSDWICRWLKGAFYLFIYLFIYLVTIS